MARAALAREIGAIIRTRGLTQKAAAAAMGIDQPKVSAILTGRLGGFSLERLAHFLTLLGKDVEIVVREKPASRPAGSASPTCSEALAIAGVVARTISASSPGLGETPSDTTSACSGSCGTSRVAT